MNNLSQLLNLNHKTAIITGGAKGIGQGIAYRLAEAGAKVLIADMDEEAGKNLTKEFTDKGWTVQSIKTDVSNEEDVKMMVAFAKENFGSLDILVNNAGIYPPAPIAQMAEEQFEKVMQVNLRSCFL